VVVAAAFNALLGPRGLLNEGLRTLAIPPVQIMGTLGIILLAHMFYNFSVVTRLVGSFWGSLDDDLESVAASLGAAPWQTFWRVTLPIAWPAIGAAAALTFLFTFTSFGVIVLLGGARFATLETEIYRQTSQALRLDIAASLAFVQLLMTLALGLISSRLQSRATVALDLQSNTTTEQPISTTRLRLVLMGLLAFIALVIFSPLLALALRSLSSQDLLRFYVALSENPRGSAFFVPPLVAIRNSVGFAGLTALLALLMGLPLAYALSQKPTRFTRLLDVLLLLPLGTSAITLGLGLFIAFDWPLMMGIDLRTSPLLLPLAHTLIALPFVVRTLLPAARAISQTLREAAAQLGATPLQVLRHIDVPLLSGPLIAAAVFAFATSLGEFGASLLIARPEYPTMPLVISDLLGRPGATNYGQAMAMSTLLMAVTLASVLVIEKLGRGKLL
jgi:thiamine transport system permease protein